MKYAITLCLLLSCLLPFAQTIDSTQKASTQKERFASFIARVDKANATKDGIYLGGYVVNLTYDQIKQLHGKKIKVTGKVTIERGLENDTPGEPIRQGRPKDTKHIERPRFEIIND